ncbi:hypothetical protein COB57_03970 [Candidatus Peregrinibacteria bacterium]|nr:MAG: hypothetical protein COB57_03970 [Candidatus Peregrinibacteria bacterium]
MKCLTQINSPSQLAEGLLRGSLGVVMLMAGIGKFMVGASVFVASMTTMFSMMSPMLITPIAYLIPVMEVLLGFSLLFGFKRELSLFLTGKLFILFILGQLIVGNMAEAQSLFLYVLVAAFALTLPKMECNCFKK